jgi:hypothetical protein
VFWVKSPPGIAGLFLGEWQGYAAEEEPQRFNAAGIKRLRINQLEVHLSDLAESRVLFQGRARSKPRIG